MRVLALESGVAAGTHHTIQARMSSRKESTNPILGYEPNAAAYVGLVTPPLPPPPPPIGHTSSPELD
eukprot:2863799-Amphidinium_carterae.1